MTINLTKYIVVCNPGRDFYIETEEKPGILPFKTLPYWLKVELDQNHEIRIKALAKHINEQNNGCKNNPCCSVYRNELTASNQKLLPNG